MRLTRLIRPSADADQRAGVDPLDNVSHGWNDLQHESSLKRNVHNTSHSREGGRSPFDPTASIGNRLACFLSRGGTVLDTVLHGLPEELDGLRFIIPNQMAFLSVDPERMPSLKKVLQTLNITCVSSDLHNQYTPFCSDFGPVNLGIVHRFCRAMGSKLAKLKESGAVLLYCMEPTFEATANASFLLGAFLVLNCGRTAAQARAPPLSHRPAPRARRCCAAPRR